jgi:hypothetical protein
MPTPTYDLIASNVLTSAASSVTFSSIPATYRDLVLVCGNLLNTNPENSNVVIRLNGDTGSNYTTLKASGDGTNTDSRSVSTTFFYTDLDIPFGNTAAQQGLSIVQFMDYSATDKHKTILSRANVANRGVGMYAGRWANTAAITSVQALIEASAGQFAIGSSFHLYGIVS